MSGVNVKDLAMGGVEVESALSAKDLREMSQRQIDDWWAGVRLLFAAMAPDPEPRAKQAEPTSDTTNQEG